MLMSNMLMSNMLMSNMLISNMLMSRQWSEMPGSICTYSMRLGFDVIRRFSMLFDTDLVMLVTSCESELSSLEFLMHCFSSAISC